MQPLTILLLEDEPIIALDLQVGLEQEGHLVLTANDAGEALRLCARHLPDVAILNFVLANSMDGMALARLLRTRFLVRVLFISGARWEDLESSTDFLPGPKFCTSPLPSNNSRVSSALFKKKTSKNNLCAPCPQRNIAWPGENCPKGFHHFCGG